MLALDSPRWSELEHAYGPAVDIPDLLRALDDLPRSDGESEPWFSLWSALAHQGDVYSASFAAVPHVVRVLSTAPDRADGVYFDFPAWIEICRQRRGVHMPFDLKAVVLRGSRSAARTRRRCGRARVGLRLRQRSPRLRP
jgi:hypothetical protein